MNKVLRICGWSVLTAFAVLLSVSFFMPMGNVSGPVLLEAEAQFNPGSGSPGSMAGPGSVSPGDFYHNVWTGGKGYVTSNSAASVTLGTNLIIPLIRGRGFSISPFYYTTVTTGSFTLLIDLSYDGTTWTTDHPVKLSWTPDRTATNGTRNITNLSSVVSGTLPQLDNARFARLTKWTNGTGVSLWITNIHYGYFRP